jgi:hypothetical protein
MWEKSQGINRNQSQALLNKKNFSMLNGQSKKQSTA